MNIEYEEVAKRGFLDTTKEDALSVLTTNKPVGYIFTKDITVGRHQWLLAIVLHPSPGLAERRCIVASTHLDPR